MLYVTVPESWYVAPNRFVEIAKDLANAAKGPEDRLLLNVHYGRLQQPFYIFDGDCTEDVDEDEINRVFAEGSIDSPTEVVEMLERLPAQGKSALTLKILSVIKTLAANVTKPDYEPPADFAEVRFPSPAPKVFPAFPLNFGEMRTDFVLEKFQHPDDCCCFVTTCRRLADELKCQHQIQFGQALKIYFNESDGQKCQPDQIKPFRMTFYTDRKQELDFDQLLWQVVDSTRRLCGWTNDMTMVQVWGADQLNRRILFTYRCWQ